jgi:hypothetical protein
MKQIMILMMVLSSSVFASDCAINEKNVCTKETCQQLNSSYSFQDGICKDVQSNESKVTDCSAVSGKQGAKDVDASSSEASSDSASKAK